MNFAFRFRVEPEAFDSLMESLDRTIKFTLEEEEKLDLDDVTNYDEVVNDIRNKLISIRDTPNRLENPLIYHLDVGEYLPFFEVQ